MILANEGQDHETSVVKVIYSKEQIVIDLDRFTLVLSGGKPRGEGLPNIERNTSVSGSVYRLRSCD